MLKKYSLTIIFLLIGMVMSTNIYPYASNPLQINPTATQFGSKFSVRFSFPSSSANLVAPYGVASSGLNYKQFIGLAFPPLVASSDLNFNSQTTQFACELTDGTNTYKMTAVASVASPVISTLTAENNIAYCRLDETNSSLVPLKTGLNVVYKLTITLTNLKITSTKFLRTLSLFTSTSNNPEKVILDALPVLGTAALQGDYTATSINSASIPFEIADTQVTLANGSSTTNVLPYNAFDVTLQFKVNSFISAADSVIVFKFPTGTVSAATSVSSLEYKTNDGSFAILQGNLDVKAFGSDGIFLDGLKEDLTANRVVRLTLRGWKAKDESIGGLGINSALEVIVYYKNTYSVVSYATKSVFFVVKDTATLTANHPEFWDVYRGGAWPITFNFSVTNSVINGGWVVIQHTNWAELSQSAGNKLTFVASTCDFSANDSSILDNSFGKRPNCYRMRTLDLTYTAPNGSAVFFFLPNIFANKNYRVNVWAFFDVCGGSSDDSMNVVYGSSSYTVPKFTLTIYKSINPLQNSENRFLVMPAGVTQNILAQSSSIEFTGKCWNHLMFDTSVPEGNHFSAAFMSKHTLTVNNDSTKRGILNYKEVYDWLAFSATVDTHPSADANSWLANPITKILRDIADTSKFLYSSTNALGGSFFAVGFPIGTIVNNNDSMIYLTALPCLYPSANNFTHPPGKWSWQFPSAWFAAGNAYKDNSATCYASWAIGEGADGATGTQLLATLTNNKLDMSAAGKNYFGAAVSTGSATLDAGLTLLPPNNTFPAGAANILRLVSTYHNGSTPNWRVMDYTKTNVVEAEKFKKVGLFTSCVKWVGTPPSITSLYANIDIQIKWNYIGTGGDTNGVGATISNMRLIKLFPETGVINEFSKNNSSGKGSVNPFVSHTIYTNTGSDSVCLIELSRSVMENLKDSSSNTLVIWIFWGTLLESDYNDLAANYPVAPLSSGVQSYGLQNGQPIEMSNPLMTKGTGNAGTDTGFTPLFYLFRTNNISASYNNDPSKNLNFKANSSYIWFMGSAVYLTSVNKSITGGTEESFFIPYYCPRFIERFKSSSTKPTGAHLFPLILSAWVNMKSHSQIYSLGNWIVYDELSLTSSGEQTMKLISNKFISGSSQDVMKTSAVMATSANVQKATLKWTPYSSTSSTLYVFNGILTAANASDITCTGHSLFLNTKISFEPNITVNFVAGYTGALGYTKNETISSNFYVFGKIFNKAIYYGLGSASAPTSANMLKLISSSSSSNSANYYTGVRRPSLEFFVQNGTLQLTDHLAYACAAVNNDKNEGLNNYVYNSSSNADNYFFVDFARTPSAIYYTNPIVGWDKTELYKNDVAGNFKVSVTPPNANQMQIGAKFAFSVTGGVININTMCGIVSTRDGIATPCDISSGTITCTAAVANFTYNICCYNVQMADTISLSNLSTFYPLDASKVGIQTYVSAELYNASNQISQSNNPFSFITNIKTGVDILNTNNASIAAITYAISNQESGIGKVTINVFLPRDPVRDMKVSINGDLSALFIPGLSPRCVASFTNSNTAADIGDILIDTCSVNTSSKAATPIVITTKKMIYKSGMAFGRNLFITLYPVNVVNFFNPAQNKNFKVNMNLNTGEALAKNDVTQDVTTTGSTMRTKAKPYLNSVWDNLLKVTNVTPRIPGEIADYTFEFDIDTGVSTSMQSPNELAIFFPYQLYGAFISDLYCYYKTEKVNCSFIEEGLLILRFSNNILSLNSKPQILITGIRNPASDTDIVFACSVSQANFSTGERTNLITGSGRLIGGINTNAVTQNGNLRFLSVDTPVSNMNPREISTHKFRISFDTAFNSNLATLPITIEKTPSLIIQFPSNYNFSLYKSNMSVNIDEYLLDVTTNKLILGAKNPTADVRVSGNRLTITLSASSKTFASNFRHWEVTIYNVNNPTDATSTSTTQTTNPYTFILTNSDTTALYRTYTNLNNYSSSAITGLSSLEANLSLNRGNTFAYTNNKFAIDVYTDASQTNNIIVKSGRYIQAYLRVRPNLNIFASPAVTTVTFTDSLFKTSGNNFSLATSYNSPLGLYIGCTCGANPGFYVIYFTHSDTNFTNFTSMAPVLVTLDTASKGVVTATNSYNVASLSTSWVTLSLSEPNFDALTINWSDVDKSNNASSSISSLNIPPMTTGPSYAVFSTAATANIVGVQSFKAMDPNFCFTMNTNIISFNVSNAALTLPQSINLSSSFRYFIADNDPNITQKNLIKFTFTPPFNPSYLYCALTCAGNSYPSDNDIILPKSINTECMQYYQSFVSSMNPIDLYYSNLRRSQQYKMKCLLQSTEVNNDRRTTYYANVESYAVVSGNVTKFNNLTTPESTRTQCVQWKLNNTITSALVTKFTEYCQNMFTGAGGYYSNGCVTCASWDKSIYAAGLPAPTAVCSSSSSPLQPIASAPSFLTICAFVNPVCATDVNVLGMNYADTVNRIRNNLISTASILQNANIDNINVNSTRVVSYESSCNEFSPVDVTKTITKMKQSTLSDSTLTINVQPDVVADCYWRINRNATIPVFSELTDCEFSFWCGRGFFRGDSTFEFASHRSFDEGAVFHVYLGCLNDVNTQYNKDGTPIVVRAASFTVPSLKTRTDNSFLLNTTSTLNSKFINYSMTFILLIATLLFY